MVKPHYVDHSRIWKNMVHIWMLFNSAVCNDTLQIHTVWKYTTQRLVWNGYVAGYLALLLRKVGIGGGTCIPGLYCAGRIIPWTVWFTDVILQNNIMQSSEYKPNWKLTFYWYIWWMRSRSSSINKCWKSNFGNLCSTKTLKLEEHYAVCVIPETQLYSYSNSPHSFSDNGCNISFLCMKFMKLK